MNMLKNKKILAAIAGALVTLVGGILLVNKGRNGRTVSPGEVEEIMKDIPQVDDLGEGSEE